MAIIPCVHDCATHVFPSSSPHNLIIIQSTYQKFHRLIYHHPDNNQVLETTPYLPTSSLITSRPFNPFCHRCEANFLLYLTCLGYDSHSSRIHVLERIQSQVIESQITLEHDGRVGGGEIVRLYNHIHLLEDRHSWDMEEYIAWITRYLQQEVRPTPAAWWAVEGLERVEAEAVEEGEACAVCLDEFSDSGGGGAEEEDEEVVVLRLPCGHMYHGACIVEWFTKSHVCPLCRFEMPKDVD